MGKKLTPEQKAQKAQEQADKREAAASRKALAKEQRALIAAVPKRKYTKKAKEGTSEATSESPMASPAPPPPPPPPHVNKTDHQLLNIHRPIQELLDLTKAKYDEDKAKEQKEQEFQLDLETQRENRLFNTRSPWTLMKPLKPSPLDDYDKAIEAKRASQRLATAPNKWVKIKSY